MVSGIRDATPLVKLHPALDPAPIRALIRRLMIVVDFEGARATAEGRQDADGCIHVTEPEGLEGAVRSVLDDPVVRRGLSLTRESAVADHYYRADGMAVDRVAEEVERLLP